MSTTWDCIVIGGGAAGLSATLVLGRARRRTLLVDAGRQSNLAAHGIGGLLGQDGRPAPEFYADGHAELVKYPSVATRAGEVASVIKTDDAFSVVLADGSAELARRVVLATGMDYRPPQLPGLDAFWGRTVFHCPFCHGWEARDGQLGVLANGPHGVHMATLLRAWSDDVTLLTNGSAELTDEARAQLAQAGVEVDERVATALEGDGEQLERVVFVDASARELTGLLVATPLMQRGGIAAALGAETAHDEPYAGERLVVDMTGQTSVAGLWAVGDTSTKAASVANAVSSGMMGGAGVVQSLMAEAAVPTAA